MIFRSRRGTDARRPGPQPSKAQGDARAASPRTPLRVQPPANTPLRMPDAGTPHRPPFDRARLIRRLVQDERIETQLGLVRALRRHGVAVTQATVSRDIKRLGLVKIPDDGHYRYALPVTAAHPGPEAAPHLRGVMAEFAREVLTAIDLILVKTVPGGAAPVAQAIDDVRWDEVAGTLAGEDTIIVVPRMRSAARAIAKRLTDLLP
jgi:transcriptional regulator of arginine metabolism